MQSQEVIIPPSQSVLRALKIYSIGMLLPPLINFLSFGSKITVGDICEWCAIEVIIIAGVCYVRSLLLTTVFLSKSGITEKNHHGKTVKAFSWEDLAFIGIIRVKPSSASTPIMYHYVFSKDIPSLEYRNSTAYRVSKASVIVTGTGVNIEKVNRFFDFHLQQGDLPLSKDIAMVNIGKRVTLDGTLLP